MERKICKRQNTGADHFDISILIPSWNNIELLKNCLSSIDKNSTLSIQPIVIVNEGKDGTLEWMEGNSKYDYIYSEVNLGICYALNIARSMVKSDYIMYANDDMYFLPGWDIELYNEIKKLGHHMFMLSSTMIEPHDTGNACVSVANFGDNIESFSEDSLLKEFRSFEKPDWKGSTWPPNIVHINLWDLVGGMSIEFSPGMYSDPDFSMKLYMVGVRHFKGLGKSLVYHFGSKSTARIKKNKGRHTYLMKWGITAHTFSSEFLHTGDSWLVDHPSPKLGIISGFINHFKRMKGAWVD